MSVTYYNFVKKAHLLYKWLRQERYNQKWLCREPSYEWLWQEGIPTRNGCVENPATNGYGKKVSQPEMAMSRTQLQMVMATITQLQMASQRKPKYQSTVYGKKALILL